VGIFTVCLAVLLLPLLGVLVSFLAETRRGIASAVVATSWLALIAALVLLVAAVAGGRVVHQDTFTFWSFPVVQRPFNAATSTTLAQTFNVGVGYAASSTTAILAVLVTLVTLLCELQMMIQFRRDPRLGQLTRLANLLAFGALLVVLAPELFQTLVGFEIVGFAAALLVGSGVGQNAGGAARSGYLVWRAGGLSLLLGVAFMYVKFSGAVATAAAAAVAAAAKHKIVLPTPDGLNLVALSKIWVAATKGLVPGVGGRSLALAAVLIVVAAACACGQLPGHGLWRSLGNAPGAAAGMVLALAGAVVGTALLLQAFPLLRLASGALPALIVLGTASSLVASILAFREHRLRRLAVWLAASQTGLVLAAIGLGSPAAALALLISSALATAALLGVVSSLGRGQRVDSIDQLGAAWRLARPTVLLLLVALAAITGVVGVGTFFGHAALLTAAFGSLAPGFPKAPALFRDLAAAGAIVSMLLLTAAGARVALIAIRGEESTDPREARLVRRQLAQGRGLGSLWPSLVATGLALISGFVSLPGIAYGVGGLLAVKSDATTLPLQWAALLASLVVPILAGAVMAARRGNLTSAASEDPGWFDWADGTRLAISADEFGSGLPARAVMLAQERAFEPVGDAVASGLADLMRLKPVAGRERQTWGVSASLVALAGVALTVALVIWVVASNAAGVGVP
jgi:NADH:ubiquinone oxidoreductase subunit 5 (subunit L)/multisubunit Na+/H+ antiporter MnhA subunit